MSVSGVSSLFDTQSLASVLSTQAASTSITPSVGSATGTEAGQPQVSKQAQFLNKLQQLATSDPAKFQQVVSDIAAKLTQAAQQQGQTTQGQALSGLAAKFQTVAQTGDLSTLQPAKPATSGVQAAYGSGDATAAALQSLTGQTGTTAQQGASGHHHGHHHHGGGSSASTTDSTTADSSTSTTSSTTAGSSSPAANALTSLFSQINQEVAAA